MRTCRDTYAGLWHEYMHRHEPSSTHLPFVAIGFKVTKYSSFGYRAQANCQNKPVNLQSLNMAAEPVAAPWTAARARRLVLLSAAQRAEIRDQFLCRDRESVSLMEAIGSNR